MSKDSTRADYVPVEPVRRALRKWCVEQGLDTKGGWNHASEHYHSPYQVLAERMGMSVDMVFRHVRGDRGYQNMQFDQADRFLAAIDQVNLWWHDPELSEVYERACRGADQIYPVVVEPEPIFCECEKCGSAFEPNNQHGGRTARYCSQACRQAAYKARKVAA